MPRTAWIVWFVGVTLLSGLLLLSCERAPSPSGDQPTGAPSEVAKNLEQDVLEARRLSQSGQSKQAVEKVQTLLERYPEYATILQAELAGAYMAANEPEQALAAVDTALVASPTDEALLMLRAQILERSGRAGEAAELYEKIIAEHPGSLRPRLHLAELQLAAGRFIEAASHYRTCSQLAPGVGSIHLRRAVIEKRLGRLEEARLAARKASALMDNDLDAHRLYQDIAITLGERESLLKEYQDRIENNPRSSTFHYLYGRIIQDPEAARAEFDIASQLDPKAFWPNFGLGIQYYLQGEYETARKQMEIALASQSADTYRAALYLCLIEMASGDYAKAVEQARAMLDQDPTNLQAFSVLHQALLEQGEYEQAEQLCEEMEGRMPPGSPFPMVYRTETALQAGWHERLRQLVEELCARDAVVPTDREALAYRLAQSAMEQKDYETAREELESASRVAELSNSKALFWLGWLQRQTGNDEAARQTWQALAASRSRRTTEPDLLYTDAARYFLGDIGAREFESNLRWLPYTEHNDYWSIRALKSWEEENPAEAKASFEKALETSRANEFPARQVRVWLKELG